MMLSLLSAAVLTMAAGTQPANHDYTLAYNKSIEEKKPLVVVVGADWCPACQALKNSTLRTMEQSGEFEDVSLAVVDRDAEPELARQLMKGETRIPQIIVYSQSPSGSWQSRKLTGFQSSQPVRSLIRRAVRSWRS